MKNIRLIGDVHGLAYEYMQVSVLPDHIDQSIQLGDMGVGMGQSDYWHESLNNHMSSNRAFFIRGNHDNPEICRNDMVNWIVDGVVKNNVMFVGGAWSIDADYRIPGYNWWREEELSESDMQMVFATYCAAEPEIMITHDCPTLAAYHQFIKTGLRTHGSSALYLTRTGELFQRMFEYHQPKFWFHGHWHHSSQLDLNGTHFHCLAEMEFVDFDVANLCYIK